jgi:hypothetical protein
MARVRGDEDAVLESADVERHAQFLDVGGVGVLVVGTEDAEQRAVEAVGVIDDHLRVTPVDGRGAARDAAAPAVDAPVDVTRLGSVTAPGTGTPQGWRPGHADGARETVPRPYAENSGRGGRVLIS